MEKHIANVHTDISPLLVKIFVLTYDRQYNLYYGHEKARLLMSTP